MADEPTDELLDVLLNLARPVGDEGTTADISVSVPVTLFFHGLVVSGTTISEKEYFEHLGAQMQRGTDASKPLGEIMVRVWREAFSELAENAARLTRRPASDGEADEPGTEDELSDAEISRWRLKAFVHLRDVRAFGVGVDGIEMELWRGRRAAIVGWTLGQAS